MNQLPLSVKWHNASENSILSTNDACFHYIGTTLPVKAKPSRVKHTPCRWYEGWDTDRRSVLDVGGSQRELFVCACGACLRWKCVLRLQIIYCWFLLVYHHTYLSLHNYSLWRCWFLGSPSFGTDRRRFISFQDVGGLEESCLCVFATVGYFENVFICVRLLRSGGDRQESSRRGNHSRCIRDDCFSNICFISYHFIQPLFLCILLKYFLTES